MRAILKSRLAGEVWAKSDGWDMAKAVVPPIKSLLDMLKSFVVILLPFN
jgi:hypothetical protein